MTSSFPSAVLAAAADPAAVSMWPLAVLGIGLVFIIVLVTVLKVHAFIALLLAAFLTGILSGPMEPAAAKKYGVKTQGHWAQSAELSVKGFGSVAEKIGVVIALAAVIGVCLVESGAADKVVRRFLALLGESRAAHALFVAGFVLSIPIFFETYFMLLLPLAQALHLRTGKSYMAYVLAICCGGTITHSLVAPHPGPLQMAEYLHLDVGHTMLCGILAGFGPALCMWMLAQYIARKVNAPLRDSEGHEGNSVQSVATLKALMEKPESELPPLWASLTPILLPLILIGGASLSNVLGLRAAAPGVFAWVEFLGERHVALMLGALSAMWLCMWQRKLKLAAVNKLISPRFAEAGVIILIASAGGAYGFMLKETGVGGVIGVLAKHWNLDLVFVAWAVSTIIRVAQGSATVAMMLASAIMAEILKTHPAHCHTMYIFLAIGFGSKMISWMNDSGFWTVSKLSGFTESETLKSWTVLVTFGSLVGLAQCLVLARLLPFK